MQLALGVLALEVVLELEAMLEELEVVLDELEATLEELEVVVLPVLIGKRSQQESGTRIISDVR
jgi:hypothetical protein